MTYDDEPDPLGFRGWVRVVALLVLWSAGIGVAVVAVVALLALIVR